MYHQLFGLQCVLDLNYLLTTTSGFPASSVDSGVRLGSAHALIICFLPTDAPGHAPRVAGSSNCNTTPPHSTSSSASSTSLASSLSPSSFTNYSTSPSASSTFYSFSATSAAFSTKSNATRFGHYIISKY